MEKTIVIDGITICIEATPTENLVHNLEPAKRAFFEERVTALKKLMDSNPQSSPKHNLIRR